jgi:hypothetical protein
MKKLLLLGSLLVAISSSVYAQVGIGTSTPSEKSILDLTSKDKGFLLPRMTTAQRNAIAPNNTTDVGMQVFDETTNSIWMWNGAAWIQPAAKNIYDSNGDISATESTDRTVNFSNGGSLNFDQNTLLIDATNNKVGIGTATPKSLLHINGTSAVSGITTSFVEGGLITANASPSSEGYAGPGFYYETPNAAEGQRVMKVNYTQNNSGQSFLNFQAVTDNAGASSRSVLSLFHNGRVGIGTFAPNANLDIISPSTDVLTGGTTVRIFNPEAPAVNNFAGIQLKSSTGVGSWKIGVNQETTTDRDQNFYFLNAGGGQFVPRMVITQVGNVGIGTIAPGSKLHVNQGNIASTNANGVNLFTTTASRVAYFSGASANNDGLLALHMSNNTNGNGYISFENSDGAAIGRITRATATSVAYNTTSDERLKESIRSTKMGIHDLMKIQVADYVYWTCYI